MLSFESFGQIRIASNEQVRYEGSFISSSYNYTKKNIYNIVKELRKIIKKSMATGIAQKSGKKQKVYLFWLCSTSSTSDYALPLFSKFSL